MYKTVWVTFQVDGLHQWKDATNYLTWPHRHVFHFRVEASVEGSDREIEFIALQQELRSFVKQDVLPGYVVPLSCEMMGERVIKWMQHNYGDRQYRVEVSEDGENGATVSSHSCTCG